MHWSVSILSGFPEPCPRPLAPTEDTDLYTNKEEVMVHVLGATSSGGFTPHLVGAGEYLEQQHGVCEGPGQNKLQRARSR